MSISYKADGSILLQGDREAERTQTIEPRTPAIERDALIAAFFASDEDTELSASVRLSSGP